MMESERKIEKLLRAFAKKRRDEAGAPLELHAASRRLLQSEVARRAPSRLEGNSFLKLFGGLRPRFAYVAGAAAVVCACAAMVLTLVNRTPRESRLAEAGPTEALRRPDQAAAASSAAISPTVPAATNGVALAFRSSDELRLKSLSPGLEPVLADKSESRKFGLPGETVKDTNLSGWTSGTLAGAPAKSAENQKQPGGEATLALNTPAPARGIAVSDGIRPGGSGGAGGVATKAGQSFAVNVAAGQAAGQSAVSVGQRFVQVGSSPELQNRDRVGSTMTVPVLTAFQMEQNGRDIQIVDSDGSVYNGSVQTEEDTKEQAANAQQAPAGQLARQPEPSTRDLQNNQTVSQAFAQNYAFRVAGTNRSLNQNVIFTGNFVTVTNGTATNPATSAALLDQARQQLAPANSQQRPSLLNSRISGTAVIDNRKEIQINALPVVP